MLCLCVCSEVDQKKTIERLLRFFLVSAAVLVKRGCFDVSLGEVWVYLSAVVLVEQEW